jgi:hypothetical protein
MVVFAVPVRSGKRSWIPLFCSGEARLIGNCAFTLGLNGLIDDYFFQFFATLGGLFLFRSPRVLAYQPHPDLVSTLLLAGYVLCAISDRTTNA